jgi:GNAT superfamily N-acetyltransferase
MWWSGIAAEHPTIGPPGLRHSRGRHHSGAWVDCLLWRDVEGHRRGALFHYRGDIPGGERRGNVNMWVDPAWHPRGIGRALLAEADRRWVLNFGQQSYTAGGLALVRSHLARSRRRGRG